MATENGTAGNDTLNGSLGADHLIGGAGDDLYIVNDVSDQVDEGGLSNAISLDQVIQGNAYSLTASFSPDGSKVLFQSDASNLVPGDVSNGTDSFGNPIPGTDIFIKDLTTGTFTRVSVDASGVQGDDMSFNAVFSPDGSKVAFSSRAGNFAAGDATPGPVDIFVKDLTSGAITRINPASDASGLYTGSDYAVFSPDGSKLAFVSTIRDSSGTSHVGVYIKDLLTGTLTQANTPFGDQGYVSASSIAFSPDGNSISYASSEHTHVDGVVYNDTNLYVKNLVSGVTTQINTNASGDPGTTHSGYTPYSLNPVYSPDGSKVMFESSDDNLVADDTNHQPDLFVKDLNTGEVTRVSTSSSGAEATNIASNGFPGNAASYSGGFSPDGTQVVFQSYATNLVPGFTQSGGIYIKNLVTGDITVVDLGPAISGLPSIAISQPSFSSDGSKIVFASFYNDGGHPSGTFQAIIVANVADASPDSGGVDTVQASVSYALKDNIENLTLTGTANLNGTGNDLDNVIIGNSGNNRLDGWTGADTLIGGAGDDTYIVNSTSDQVVELNGEGIDTLESSASYSLYSSTRYIEDLTLTGSANINAKGNSLANNISGNDGGNILWGGAGADTMAGGLGSDIYVVSNAGDVVFEQANSGGDTVYSRIDYTLTDNVENLHLTYSAVNGTGNELANILIGNSMDNTLSGGAGNDSYRLDRSSGHDTLIDNDAALGNSDSLTFASDVSADQLWFSHVGNDLEIDIIGTANSATIKDWYLGSDHHIEVFKSGDGKTLTDSNVDNLVSAMAGLTPPSSGVTTLSPSLHTTLDPVIAVNWV